MRSIARRDLSWVLGLVAYGSSLACDARAPGSDGTGGGTASGAASSSGGAPADGSLSSGGDGVELPSGGASTAGVSGAGGDAAARGHSVAEAGGSGGAGSGGAPSGGAGAGGLPAGGGAGVLASGGDAATGGGGSSDGCEAGVFDGVPPAVLTLEGDTFAHDPTMVQVEGRYYRFWTGAYVPSASSSDLLRWTNGPSVYPGSYPPWVSDWLSGVGSPTFNFPWAPDASVFDGRIHLYASFSARFGDNVSCITHLSTDDLAENDWADHGPILCTEGSESYNAIDADVGFDAAGRPWLAFGSFWDGIQAFELHPDGSRKGQELVRLAWASEIEAPVLFRRCGYYYLFVTWGLCCPGEGRSVNELSYRVAVGRSENITGPYVDRAGKALLEGGGTLVTEGDGVAWAAAGHSDVLVDGAKIYHLYHAYEQSTGAASLRIAELLFDPEGWPVPHPP